MFRTDLAPGVLLRRRSLLRQVSRISPKSRHLPSDIHLVVNFHASQHPFASHLPYLFGSVKHCLTRSAYHLQTSAGTFLKRRSVSYRFHL